MLCWRWRSQHYLLVKLVEILNAVWVSLHQVVLWWHRFDTMNEGFDLSCNLTTPLFQYLPSWLRFRFTAEVQNLKGNKDTCYHTRRFCAHVSEQSSACRESSYEVRNPPQTGPTLSDNLAGRLIIRARERFAKPLQRESPAEPQSQEESQKAAAMQDLIALSLAALATQAYIKSVLCPSLAQYSPRVPNRRVSILIALSIQIWGTVSYLLSLPRCSITSSTYNVPIHKIIASIQWSFPDRYLCDWRKYGWRNRHFDRDMLSQLPWIWIFEKAWLLPTVMPWCWDETINDSHA